MKREIDNLDLRAAFRAEPEGCHRALMDAARSVREEKKTVKRFSMKLVVVAAIIVLSMTAVAYAAGKLLGWTDFFGDYSNTVVPQDALQQMQVTEDLSWQVGPLTFTATELLTDGHIAISAIHVRTTDGSPALITGANTCDPVDPIRANGETGKAMEQRLGLAERATWLDAAAQLNLPLYRVSAEHDMTHPLCEGEMMIDVLYNEDSSVTFFCLSMLDTERVQDTLTLPLCLDVMLADPVTGEGTERWRDYDQTVTIPVCPVLESRTYIPETELVIEGQKLLKVEAVRYATGAYLTLTYEMNWEDVSDRVYGLHDATVLCDVNGNRLPDGMSMTSSMSFTITEERMLGVDALPDTLQINGVNCK